jgi:hypothetical protein
MTVGLWHGDACTRCPEARPGRQPLPATHNGMCAMCWLGATEGQRRSAIMDEGGIEAVRAAQQVAVLEAMLSLSLTGR